MKNTNKKNTVTTVTEIWVNKILKETIVVLKDNTTYLYTKNDVINITGCRINYIGYELTYNR